MRKATKTIISFAVILIAGLNFIVPAFAQDPFTAVAVGGLSGASGAGLFGSMAGMSGINIGWSQSGADPLDAMWNVLNPDHVYFTGEKHEATNIGEDVYDYIQVDIGDWLTAQAEFISNLVNTYEIEDNDTGTITGTKSFNGIPFVATSGSNIWSETLGTLVAPSINGESVTLEVGPYKVVSTKVSNGRDNDFYYNGILYGSGHDNNARAGLTLDFRLRTYTYSSNVTMALTPHDNITTTAGGLNSAIGTAVSPENVSWTSETVNTSVFDGWESAKVKIPTDMSQLQAGWTLTDFLNELNRIWSGAGEDNIIIEDGGDTPVPPVPPSPVPDTPLGEVPFDDWVDLWGQGIYQQLENQSDALDLIGSNGEDAIEDLESIDSNLDALNQTAESIDTNIGIGNGILSGIRSLAQSAVDYLEGIAEHVGELVEEIVEGTETLIAGILNQIPQAFGVIFGPIKQASSIWHYVVEWIQSIGAPFQFIWSMASGTSYYIILPVYASLAASVVLAFYKRFGK